VPACDRAGSVINGYFIPINVICRGFAAVSFRLGDFIYIYMFVGLLLHNTEIMQGKIMKL
jgi:hypothetical protein